MEVISKDIFNKCAMIAFGPRPIPAWALAKVFESLPEDAVMLRHVERPESAQWGWVIASKHFNEVKEGEILPRIEARIDGVKKTVELLTPLNSDSFLDELESL